VTCIISACTASCPAAIPHLVQSATSSCARRGGSGNKKSHLGRRATVTRGLGPLMRRVPSSANVVCSETFLSSLYDHRRNFVCDDGDFSPPLLKVVVTSHHDFFKVEFAFCGLKYAENAIAAGAPPRTPLGELTTLPQRPYSAGERTPLPIPHPIRRLWRLDARAFGASIVVPPDTKSWRRHWSPPLYKVNLLTARRLD